MGAYNSGKTASGKQRSNPLRDARKAGKITNSERVSKHGKGEQREANKAAIKEHRAAERFKRGAKSIT
jgi:hypothetical protein